MQILNNRLSSFQKKVTYVEKVDNKQTNSHVMNFWNHAVRKNFFFENFDFIASKKKGWSCDKFCFQIFVFFNCLSIGY